MDLLKPKKDVFRYGSVDDAYFQFEDNQIHQLFDFERCEYEYDGVKGCFVFYKDFLYPVKGFVFPEACYANDTFKATVMLVAKGFTVFSLFKIRKIIDAIVKLGYNLMRPYILKPEYWCPAARELGKLAEYMGFELKLENPYWLGEMVSYVFEYDNVYRYPLQDLMSLTEYEWLIQNPRKEIMRVFEIYKIREHRNIKNKIGLLVRLFCFLLLFGKIRRAFVESIKKIDFQSLRLDNTDKYYLRMWGEYDFWGQSFEARQEELREMHGDKKLPEKIKIKRVTFPIYEPRNR